MVIRAILVTGGALGLGIAACVGLWWAERGLDADDVPSWVNSANDRVWGR